MSTTSAWPLRAEDVPSLWHQDRWDVDEDALLDAAPPPVGGPGPARRELHQRLIDAHGGIVSTRELLHAGIPEEHIRILRDHGILRRIRKGWYCLPALDAVNALAWLIGGPLACVSALVRHGLLDPADLRSGDGLHVARREHSSRRLSALSVRACADALGVVDGAQPPTLHWSSRDFRSGDRLAVSPEVALEQARHCRPVLAARARTRATAPRERQQEPQQQQTPERPSGSAPPSGSR